MANQRTLFSARYSYARSASGNLADRPGGVFLVVFLLSLIFNVMLCAVHGNLDCCGSPQVTASTINGNAGSSDPDLPTPLIPSHDVCRHSISAFALSDAAMTFSPPLTILAVLVMSRQAWAHWLKQPPNPPPQHLAA